MALSNGTRLGPYEINGPLGQGAMGQVYRARDTRLDRPVAVKVLSSAHAATPEQRARFEREARAASQLVHPRICTLFDVGQNGGVDYLVMELVDGETLAAALARGPLTIERAIRIATEIADALSAAHRAGLVHRDLKPANVMLTKSGVKLLDFGVALLGHRGVPGATGLSGTDGRDSASTVASSLAGEIVGTLHYMAPEQLEGKAVDGRADIFALGAVIYEMLTGVRAFDGESPASVIGAVLKEQPRALIERQRLVPRALDRVVRKCLEKDADSRWQTAADLRDELAWLADEPSTSSTDRSGNVGKRGSSSPAPRQRLSWLVAAVSSIVSLGLVGYMLANRSIERGAQVARMSIPLRPGEHVNGHGAMAVSPDGNVVVFSAGPNTTAADTQLFVRRLDRLEPAPLKGTEGGTDPFFSPDGQWVGFFAGGKLRKVRLDGSAAMVIADAPHMHGAAWARDNTIYFVPNQGGTGIWQVAADGGTPTRVTEVDKASGEAAHEWPTLSPDGEFLAFVTWTNDVQAGAGTIVIQALKTGLRKTVVEGGTWPRFTADGHLLFVRDATLFAVPTNSATREAVGSPVEVLSGISSGSQNGAAKMAIAADGTLIYEPGADVEGSRRIVRVNRHGAESSAFDDGRIVHGYFLGFALSPDGNQIAVYSAGGIRLYDLRRGTATMLLRSPAGMTSTWSSDGSKIFFADRSPQGRLKAIPSNGSGPEETLWQSPAGQRVLLFPQTPAERIAFAVETSAANGDLWTFSLSTRTAAPFLQSPAHETGATYSPNQKYIAFESNASGRVEVYVRATSGRGEQLPVSTEGGFQPVWSRDGRELFYRSGRRLMAVDVRSEPTLVLGVPRVLFEGDYVGNNANFQLSPDGQYFYFVKQDVLPDQPMVVVKGWTEELRRMMQSQRSR